MTISFAGADLKFAWDVVPPADWVTTGSDWEDPYLKDYRIRLRNTAGTVTYATYYTVNRHFILTKEQNAEANSGTPLRDFIIGIAMRDQALNVYTELTQEFANPAPAAPTLTLTSSGNSITITVSNCADYDYSKTRVWVSTTNGFTPGSTTPAFDAPQTTFTYPATPATYYVRAAHYDDYSSATADLNVSSQSSITIGGIVAGDFDTVAPATPTGLGMTSALAVDTDVSQVISLTATWTANSESDLDHYELALQQAAGAFQVYPTAGSTVSYSWYGVKANTSYTVKILAVDKTGNRSSYSSTVTITSAHDTTAPSAPTSLTATAAITSIFINWTNPSAADLDHVDIYENTTNTSGTATKIATVPALPSAPNSYTRSGIASGTTLYYWVKASDTSGNDSSFSSGANATTATVNTADIAANAVTAAKIAANTITASQIAAGTITATEIAAATITAAKLNVSTLSAITANLGTVTAGSITIGSGTTFAVDTGGNVSIKSATSGQRLELTNSLLKVYDSGGTLRVELGIF